MVNHLLKLLELYPDKPWHWHRLSRNPNITLEFIQNNPDKHWNWRNVSTNLNITWEIIQNNPDKPWDWSCLSMNYFHKNKNLRFVMARKIQRMYRTYKYRKFVKRCALRYHIKCLIEYMPNRGVRYFDLLYEVTELNCAC